MPSLWKRKEHRQPGSSRYTDNGESETKYRSYKNRDRLPDFQSPTIRNNQLTNAHTRHLYTKQSPTIWQHTHGLVNLLLNKPPKFFMYVKPDFDADNIEELAQMDHVHMAWQQAEMYETFKEAFAQALGVNSACIVKFGNPKNPQWLVFNSSHIQDGKIERDPKTLEVTRIRFIFNSSSQGYAKGSNFTGKLDVRTIDAVIGVNAVLITPIPSVDNALGSSDVTKVWDMAVFKALNRYYSMIFNKKGGIGSRVLMAPDNIDAVWRKRFEQEAQKGLASELIEMFYPAALANGKVDISKLVQWKENSAGNVDFNKLDAMLAKDSPLPPSFSEGPASGALGGQAPVEDSKTINRVMLGYVSKLTKAVHDINETFFGIKQRNYAVVPFLDEEGGEQIASDYLKPALKEDDPPESKKLNSQNGTVTLKRVAVKTHSNGAQSVTYEGNLFQSGTYTYKMYDFWTDESIEHQEIMSAEALIEMIDNPLKLHQGYIDIEHEATFGGNINFQDAIGKIDMQGYEIQADGSVKDRSVLTFKKEYDPGTDEIKLSATFSHDVEERDGKIYQIDLDMKGGALVHYSMSEANGMSTIATKTK